MMYLEDVRKSSPSPFLRYLIKTPDAIIAATAMVHGFEVVTNNVDDFTPLKPHPL